MALTTSNDIRPEACPSLTEELTELKGLSYVSLNDPAGFKSKAMHFLNAAETGCLLYNAFPDVNTANHEFIMGVGVRDEVKSFHTSGGFEAIKSFCDKHAGEWILGGFSYDLKNDIEELSSENDDVMGFPEFHFFVPEELVILRDSIAYFRSTELPGNDLISKIEAIEPTKVSDPKTAERINWHVRPDESTYLSTIKELKEEIRLGNIYEVNYCRELRGEAELDVVATFEKLIQHSPAPFSTLYKNDRQYLLSVSPERFLKKSGTTLTAQPMKGTAARLTEPAADKQQQQKLIQDPKERAENIMITDLVRNDLSRSAATGSVQVKELCGVYAFPHVHQMISTITSELRTGIHFIDAIKSCFPMGSMTGAPKLRSMKLIEKHEVFKRGLFSGSVGYITPSQNFDFNVVIRSLLYHAEKRQVSIRTGSAITALSQPALEWKECELKAKALKAGVCVKSIAL